MSDRIAVGIVGVGRMGANMARRLSETGHRIAAIYDVNAAAAAELASELHAVHAGSPGAMTRASDVILTVVSDDAAMRSIFSEGDGSLLENARGKLFINCATVSPAVHVAVAALAEARGAETLEACMASSIPQARNGTLYLMVAGTERAYARARPVLDSLASVVRYIGPSGSAAQVKALVNMVMNANTAALAEGLGLGAALGLDLDLLRDVFAGTGANSRVLETDGLDMVNREHDVFFSAAHAAKDTGIALALAAANGLDLPLARASKAQFDRLIELGLGDLDKSGVAELTFPHRAGN